MNYTNRGQTDEHNKYYKLNITVSENGFFVDDKEQLGNAARYWTFETFDSMIEFLFNNLAKK